MQPLIPPLAAPSSAYRTRISSHPTGTFPIAHSPVPAMAWPHVGVPAVLGEHRGRPREEKRGQQCGGACHEVALTAHTALRGCSAAGRARQGRCPRAARDTRETQAGLWPAPLRPHERVTAGSDSVRPHILSPWPLGYPGEMVAGGRTPVRQPEALRAAASAPNSTEHLDHRPAPPSSPFPVVSGLSEHSPGR